MLRLGMFGVRKDGTQIPICTILLGTLNIKMEVLCFLPIIIQELSLDQFGALEAIQGVYGALILLEQGGPTVSKMFGMHLFTEFTTEPPRTRITKSNPLF